MSITLYTHPAMLGHQPGPEHPERPERLAAVLEALEAAEDLRLERREAPHVTVEELLRVHRREYVEAITHASPRHGLIRLDDDTWMSAGSLDAARRAAGAVVAAVRDVAAGRTDRAFCAVRPPGHHAEPETFMGFCIFSNVAVGARAAQDAGLGRIAVVDFDVHHGNGTQAAFSGQEGLFFASVQQWPMWPNSGHPRQPHAANIANAIVAPGASPAQWRSAFESVLERVDAWAPDLIMISAGFDAHERDPIGGYEGQSLTEEDFAWATAAIMSVARSRTKGRVVSALEGGYDLAALARSAVAHVRALQEG